MTAGPNVSTGGNGAAVAPPLWLAITDSASSVTLTADHKVLLVSNAGSNTISSFRVSPDGEITYADQIASSGIFPNSIAVTGHGKYLGYVLNEGSNSVSTAFQGASGSVSGFTVNGSGTLKAIPGSTRAITGGLNSAAVGFDANGHVLTVTNRGLIFAFAVAPNGTVSTWTVGSNGSAPRSSRLRSVPVRRPASPTRRATSSSSPITARSKAASARPRRTP